MRPHDCTDYTDQLAPPEPAQVSVIVNYAGTDWRVIYHPEGGIQISVSMRFNDGSSWCVPHGQDADANRVAEAAWRIVGEKHPFKARA